ncbi:hypothetical protein ACN47E_002732 [Coniothyrium glycines]
MSKTLYYRNDNVPSIANVITGAKEEKRYSSIADVPPFSGQVKSTLFLGNHGASDGKVYVKVTATGTTLQRYNTAADYYTSLFAPKISQVTSINKIVYFICWAGVANVSRIMGKTQLLPMDCISVEFGTPLKLKVRHCTAHTIEQILAFSATQALEAGWKLVEAGTVSNMAGGGASGQSKVGSQAGTGPSVECSGCMHDSQVSISA